MSLHLRLFLLLSLLLTLTLGGALWGLRLLTRDLSAAVDATVVHVGRAVAQIFEHGPEGAHAPPATAGGPQHIQEHRIVLKRVEREVQVDAGGAAPQTSGTAPAPVRVLRLEMAGPEGDLRLEEGDGHTARLIRVPRDSFRTALAAFTRNLWLGAGLVLALALPLAWCLARRVAAPLKALTDAAQAVGGGAFGQTAAVSGPPEVQRAIGTFNRMSQQLAALETERQRLQHLAQLSELGEVGRGLAHGLRNPLNTIALSLDALPDVAPDAGGGALKATARAQIQRIDEALKGFLALAAGGAAHGEASDLRTLVEDLWCEASQRSAGRVMITTHLPEHPLVLPVLLPELRAALQAPLVNALEASPEGGAIEISLAATTAATGSPRARLRIADRGAGIAPEIRERLFSAHLSSKPDGAGMGLFLAARILKDRYDGHIDIHPRPGGGTEVRIEFGARRDG